MNSSPCWKSWAMTSRSVLVPWVLMRSVISPFCLCQNSIAWHQLRFGIFLWIVRILVLESKKNRTSREFLQHDWGACFSAFFFVFQEDFQASPRLPPGFPRFYMSAWVIWSRSPCTRKISQRLAKWYPPGWPPMVSQQMPMARREHLGSPWFPLWPQYGHESWPVLYSFSMFLHKL